MEHEKLEAGNRIYSYFFWAERRGTITGKHHYPGNARLGFPAKDCLLVKWEDSEAPEQIEPECVSEYPRSNGHGISLRSLSDKCRERASEQA